MVHTARSASASGATPASPTPLQPITAPAPAPLLRQAAPAPAANGVQKSPSVFLTTVALTSKAGGGTSLCMPRVSAEDDDLEQKKADHLGMVNALDGTVYMRSMTKGGRPGIYFTVHAEKTQKALDSVSKDADALAAFINNRQVYLLPSMKKGKPCSKQHAEMYCSCKQSMRQGTKAHRRRDCTNAKCEHMVAVWTCKICRPDNFCPGGHRKNLHSPYCRFCTAGDKAQKRSK